MAVADEKILAQPNALDSNNNTGDDAIVTLSEISFFQRFLKMWEINNLLCFKSFE